MTRTRLYLDIDGVLNPSTAGWAGNEWKCRPKVYSSWFGTRVRVAMPMVHLLEDFIERYDIELVWLTTWLANDAVNQHFLPRLGALAGGRLLNYPEGADPRDPATWDNFIDWKWRELERDQEESPSDFIWIDDDEVPEFGATAGELARRNGNRALPIAPMPHRGITRDHMRSIREFLEA